MSVNILNKILKKQDLTKKINQLKTNNKSIALSHGVFDLLHIGHIKHFNSVKDQCDCLIVSITSDEFVNKGPNRPYFNTNQRAYSIASLDNVDYVVISNYQTAEKIISLIKPNIYAKGPDYKNNQNDLTGNIYKEINSAKKYKAKIIYTADDKYSSSSLINKHFNKFNNEQNSFINQIKKNYSFSQIISIFEKLNDSKILLFGETIIDEYIFCEALGKSGKEPVLVVEEKDSVKYLGGVGHIANNICSFAKNLKVFTNLGNNKKIIESTKKKFNKNAKIFSIHKKNSALNIKKRYIETNNNIKLLGVYELDSFQMLSTDEKNLIKGLQKSINSKTTLLIIDYGHNLITEKVIKKINNLKNKIIVNTQVNASNIGYHNMNKYKNVDLFFVNEQELRYEMKDRQSKLDDLIKSFSKKNNFKEIIVTCGQKGAIYYNSRNHKFISCPAFGSKIVDKIGSGDTMLSIISLLKHNNVDISLSLFVASIAAIQSLESMGNSKSLNKTELLKTIDHILS
tara:strand:- start:186 stop:1721 length:1536 start_codon:yes stop_codon:yes gene_type:complete